jgi:hypothetical protein
MAAGEFEILDLRKYENCLQAARGAISRVYNLAADMGASLKVCVAATATTPGGAKYRGGRLPSHWKPPLQ